MLLADVPEPVCIRKLRDAAFARTNPANFGSEDRATSFVENNRASSAYQKMP